MVGFVHAFFNNRNGVYRYLSELLVPQEKGSYKLQPHNVVVDAASSAIFRGEHLSAYAARVIHGSVPALAWSVEIGGKSIVVSGDTNGEGADLVHLAKDADLFIAHNAVPEGASGVERQLHMPPSVIGQIAQEAHVKRLVLSHRMLRTLGRKSRAYRKSVRTFRALLHLQTISIASPYGKVPFLIPRPSIRTILYPFPLMNYQAPTRA